jgi:hypothetical protein
MVVAQSHVLVPDRRPYDRGRKKKPLFDHGPNSRTHKRVNALVDEINRLAGVDPHGSPGGTHADYDDTMRVANMYVKASKVPAATVARNLAFGTKQTLSRRAML